MTYREKCRVVSELTAFALTVLMVAAVIVIGVIVS